LRPKKNPSGQRIYARTDIESIVEIKNLLYNQRYTISGAKRMLARQGDGPEGLSPGVGNVTLAQGLGRLKAHVQELLALLQQMPTR
jgi:DNA-binding transcriptional MerR regulator